ncbi:hypothetical protein K504DRAFT_509042 [Pleomassaria siparia CBS 279.74]|uniref:Uncharacterized protein n=1 Tax=Pleomassaria siparia CBS 279.74 TaxID=1314801 RepID=A0A6G1JPI4_9PLEO|nr:hypothetical protein K504DRAFT_509042 [Pleomassaria siparia CBS 279.74]
MLQYLKDTVKSIVLVYQHTVDATPRRAQIRGLNLWHSLLLAKVFTFFLRVYVKNLPRPLTLETTQRQEGAWAAVQQHLVNCNGTYPAVDPTYARSKLNAFKRLCDEFWLSLIKQTLVASDFEFALVTALAFIAGEAVRQRKGAGEAETKEGASDKWNAWIYRYLTTDQVRYGETLDAVIWRHGNTVTIGDVLTMFGEYAAIVWQV